MRPERGGRGKKFGNALFVIWNPCNPLRFHKTTKAFFLQKHKRNLENLQKVRRPAIIPPVN
jgi:hypothetical protein